MEREKVKRWSTFLLLFSCLGSTSVELRGQTIVAPSGRTLFNGATLIRSSVEANRSALEADGQSVNVMQYVPVQAVVYGVYPKWTVIVAQPYVNLNVTTRSGNRVQQENLNGLADTRLFVQYDGLYHRNSPGGLTRLSGVFGLQLPTGAQRFSTRAVEYTGGLIFEKAVKLKNVFSGDFEYTFATENKRRMSVGDHARFDGAVSHFVISQDKTSPAASRMRKAIDRLFRHGAYLILELNGTWQAQGRAQGNKLENTGGTIIAFSPGLQYFLSNSLLVEFSAPVPVVKALNGTQPKPQTSFVFGFRYLL